MTVRVYVPALAEFAAIVDAARAVPGCVLREPVAGYWRIEARDELRFERKPLRLGPALWNCALAGGFSGRIVQYDRDVLRIVSGD